MLGKNLLEIFEKIEKKIEIGIKNILQTIDIQII
jgi:hypothetical protein